MNMVAYFGSSRWVRYFILGPVSEYGSLFWAKMQRRVAPLPSCVNINIYVAIQLIAIPLIAISLIAILLIAIPLCFCASQSLSSKPSHGIESRTPTVIIAPAVVTVRARVRSHSSPSGIL